MSASPLVAKPVLITDRDRVVAENSYRHNRAAVLFWQMRGWPRRSVRAGWHPHCSLPTAAQASHDVARSDAGSTTGPRRSVIYLDSSVALAHLLVEDRFPAEDLWRQQLVSSRLLEYEV